MRQSTWTLRSCCWFAASQAKTHSIGRGLTFLDKLYNKAIRDKIPEIIKIKGETCELRRLTNTEFLPELEKK
jgi:hypothetical protein